MLVFAAAAKTRAVAFVAMAAMVCVWRAAKASATVSDSVQAFGCEETRLMRRRVDATLTGPFVSYSHGFRQSVLRSSFSHGTSVNLTRPRKGLSRAHRSPRGGRAGRRAVVMATLENFLDAAAAAVNANDGATLARLLDVNLADAARAVEGAIASDAGLNLGAQCASKIRAPYDEIFAHHCQCLAAKAENRGDDAFVSCKATTEAFVKDYRTCDTAWAIDALVRFVKNARELADVADAEAVAAKKKPERLHDAGALLMLVYRNSSNTSVKEKKRASLFLVVMLFKIYFKLNTLHLCKNLINAVNLPTFPPFEGFPKSQRVTYSYYVGRLAVFDDDFEKAETHLTYAFEKCPRTHLKNKTLTLKYLVPVKLALGKLPTKALLEKYGLDEFVEIADALRQGNVRKLNDALAKFQVVFIMQGTFLVLERLRELAIRTLFVKVHAYCAAKYPAKANQVSLALFLRALHWLGCDEMDLDEVECVVANLIMRKRIKGYVSHEKRVVVLSKVSPFPPWC